MIPNPGIQRGATGPLLGRRPIAPFPGQQAQPYEPAQHPILPGAGPSEMYPGSIQQAAAGGGEASAGTTPAARDALIAALAGQGSFPQPGGRHLSAEEEARPGYDAGHLNLGPPPVLSYVSPGAYGRAGYGTGGATNTETPHGSQLPRSSSPLYSAQLLEQLLGLFSTRR